MHICKWLAKYVRSHHFLQKLRTDIMEEVQERIGRGGGGTLSRRLITDIMRGCRKASRTEVPRKVFRMGCSRDAIKPPLPLVSQPPRSSFSTRVTRHWWEGRPPSRYSGCRGDSVHPADITCQHCRVALQAQLMIMSKLLLVLFFLVLWLLSLVLLLLPDWRISPQATNHRTAPSVVAMQSPGGGGGGRGGGGQMPQQKTPAAIAQQHFSQVSRHVGGCTTGSSWKDCCHCRAALQAH